MNGPLVPCLPARARSLQRFGPLDSSPPNLNEYGKGPRDRIVQQPRVEGTKGPNQQEGRARDAEFDL
jgi:hypothetical protein